MTPLDDCDFRLLKFGSLELFRLSDRAALIWLCCWLIFVAPIFVHFWLHVGGPNFWTHRQKLTCLLLLNQWNDSLSGVLLHDHVMLLVLETLNKGLELSFLVQLCACQVLIYASFQRQVIILHGNFVFINQWRGVFCKNRCHRRMLHLLLLNNVSLNLHSYLVELCRDFCRLQHRVKVAISVQSGFICCACQRYVIVFRRRARYLHLLSEGDIHCWTTIPIQVMVAIVGLRRWVEILFVIGNGFLGLLKIIVELMSMVMVVLLWRGRCLLIHQYSGCSLWTLHLLLVRFNLSRLIYFH